MIETLYSKQGLDNVVEMIDTKLKHYVVFHPQNDGKIKVMNGTLVQLLRGYNSDHQNT